jgi:hypothetical protein
LSVLAVGLQSNESQAKSYVLAQLKLAKEIVVETGHSLADVAMFMANSPAPTAPRSTEADAKDSTTKMIREIQCSCGTLKQPAMGDLTWVELHDDSERSEEGRRLMAEFIDKDVGHKEMLNLFVKAGKNNYPSCFETDELSGYARICYAFLVELCVIADDAHEARAARQRHRRARG